MTHAYGRCNLSSGGKHEENKAWFSKHEQWLGFYLFANLYTCYAKFCHFGGLPSIIGLKLCTSPTELEKKITMRYKKCTFLSLHSVVIRSACLVMLNGFSSWLCSFTIPLFIERRKLLRIYMLPWVAFSLVSKKVKLNLRSLASECLSFSDLQTETTDSKQLQYSATFISREHLVPTWRWSDTKFAYQIRGHQLAFFICEFYTFYTDVF